MLTPPDSYVKNCLLMPRTHGDVLFTLTEDGQVLASLDGYTILPNEQYKELLADKAITESLKVGGLPNPL